MLILKLLQSLVKALHSDGTPGQLAAGLVLGSILGFTPLLSLHNAIVFALIIILNVSFPAAMLGWAIAIPLGFILDPLYDAVGRALLLDVTALRPLWTTLSHIPVFPLTNFNNTVVLGSLVTTLVLIPPMYVLARRGVERYRATVGERIGQSKLYKAITASKLYNVYRLFRPES